jgi:hypothetical protein
MSAAVTPTRTIEEQSTFERHSVEEFWMVRSYEHLSRRFLSLGAVENLRQPRLDFLQGDKIVWLVEAQCRSRLHAEVQHCVQSDEHSLTFRELTEEIFGVSLPRWAVL